jgi:hypothetical protein
MEGKCEIHLLMNMHTFPAKVPSVMNMKILGINQLRLI